MADELLGSDFDDHDPEPPFAVAFVDAGVIGSSSPVGPPPPPKAPPPFAARGKADVVVVVPGLGAIRYYDKDKRMEATCAVHASERCRLTRGTRVGVDPDYGRPIGFMMLWLQRSHLPHVAMKAEHTNPFFYALLCSAIEDRRAAREALKALPNGPELMAFERPRRDDEPDEPLTPPVY